MPTLELDKIGSKRLDKLKKKHRNIQDRYDKTKKLFDNDSTNHSLDFKAYKSRPGISKIRLLGENDGRRLLLKPDSQNNKFYVFDIIEHDDQ